MRMNGMVHQDRGRAAVRKVRARVGAAGWLILVMGGMGMGVPAACSAQGLFDGPEDVIPAGLDTLYIRGLNYLTETQEANGGWPGGMGAQPAVVGLAVLSVLAHGEDPNFGPYRDTIRRALAFLMEQQNAESGYIGSSMYNHGFATLALAEAYGAVDDPKLGAALASAVRLILKAQQVNGYGAWRYSPTSQDADTTVSGAQMVALFAARNAGLAVPEEAVEKGLRFYVQCQSDDGGFGYTGPGGSNGPRTAIGALVFELAHRKSTRPYEAAMRYLRSGTALEGGYYHYYIYYASQAHFHAGQAAWEEWNQVNLKLLSASQLPDGSWESNYGGAFGTACALLSVALNYRFLPIYER